MMNRLEDFYITRVALLLRLNIKFCQRESNIDCARVRACVRACVCSFLQLIMGLNAVSLACR